MIGTDNVTDVMNLEVGKMQHLQKYTANFAYISLPYIEGGIHVEYHHCCHKNTLADHSIKEYFSIRSRVK